MPLPRAVARLNKRYTNRFIEPVVSRMASFVVVHHAGRSSGRAYRTPLYAFTSDRGLIIALTYGVGADWTQNVLTSGGTIERGGEHHVIEATEIVDRAAAWPSLPPLVRFWLRVLRVHEFALLTARPQKPGDDPRQSG